MQTRASVDDLIIGLTAPIRTGLEVLNRTAAGIVFIVDADRVLHGVLTDGDIRRALLKGASLDTDVASVMQRNFVALPASAPPETVLGSLSERIRLIPLVDGSQRVVDYASFDHVHWMPVMEPALAGNELKYVMECIKTNWISSQGRFVTEFEAAFERHIGRGHALTVMNGTVALHLALAALGIGPGDEVLVPDLTFAASANAVLYTGARPVLVDVNAETWTIDPDAAEAAITPSTRAIMPVHLYGHPADMDALREIAGRHDLLLIEDAAEAVGARYRGEVVGSFGDAACFSFFGNKIITTGEGGMVVFARHEDWERARMLRDHGMSRERRYWHTDIGFNYRMTNLQAAIGLAQLERLDHVLEDKRRVSEAYHRAVADVPWLKRPPCASWADNVYWLYTVLVDPAGPLARDEVLGKLKANGIESRPIFFPLHEMPPYYVPEPGGRFDVSTSVSRRGISLPSAPRLQDGEVQRVVDSLKRIHEIKSLWASGAGV